MRGGRAGATSNLVMRWIPQSPIALELGGWIRMGGGHQEFGHEMEPHRSGVGDPGEVFRGGV